MSFLAPLWLLLGAAAAVPLLLHLMRRNVARRVDFPAVRYLERAEREHSKSLRIRNLLLMLLRIVLVLAIAFAAARPFVRGMGVGHGPVALAIVLDNSLSTTAVTAGAPAFDALRRAARAVLEQATPADRLWLVTADGRVRGGTRDALLADLAAITPIEDAGDLALALRRADGAVRSVTLPARAIAVLTDGQRTAWREPVDVATPVTVHATAGAPPANRAVTALDASPGRWTPRGALSARITAADSAGYRMAIGTRTAARGIAAPDEPVQLRLAPPERGWHSVRAELEPDDFTADDRRETAVWIGPPPAVTADPSAGPFVAAALGTLAADGRVSLGAGVTVASADIAAALPALLLPPADPARLGAANRALARLGVPWRYGTAVTGTTRVAGAALAGASANVRHPLERAGAAETDTLAAAGGAPWIVAGPGYVLLGSRLDPAATDLPVRAAFIPWLADALALRLGAPSGDLGAPIVAAPSAVIRLPAGADALESTDGARRLVQGTQVTAPAQRGVWFVMRGARRIGALVVAAPPAESDLARWSPRELPARVAGGGARGAATSDALAGAVYAAGTRRPALVPLLMLALLLLAAESLVVRSSRTIRSAA